MHHVVSCRKKQPERKNYGMAVAEIDCIEKIAALVPHLLGIPQNKICVDYDEMADVLYVNFKKHSHADDSDITDDDVIIRYENGQVVGMTFLNSSKRKINRKNIIDVMPSASSQPIPVHPGFQLQAIPLTWTPPLCVLLGPQPDGHARMSGRRRERLPGKDAKPNCRRPRIQIDVGYQLEAMKESCKWSQGNCPMLRTQAYIYFQEPHSNKECNR